MTLTSVELAVGCNEASDLLPVLAPEVLAAHGARRAFWTVLDEGTVEQCLALLLERQDGIWTAHHAAFDAGVETGRTEDGEALARSGEWVYVIGSHFGSKGGPLRPKRAFFARFREADAGRPGAAGLQIVRNQFRLHRLVNDALAAADITPLPPGNRVRTRFIVETINRGTAREKTWATRLTPGDLPLNVEAAAFTPSGTLLLGLRFPVTEKGEPVLVEVAGVEGMFDDDSRTWPEVVRAYALTGVTPPGALVGFRALTAVGDGMYEAVVGSIDALGKGSVLLDDHPEGGDVTSRHIRFRLPTPDGGRQVAAELIADLAPFHNVEGLAVAGGQHVYVTDEDHRVAVWLS
ncbi:hypothetical protein [Phytohabitans suffuscus]|uniref:DUF4185 domain-containing protein n=1 Tax=Phytohabitans suffuscus TaxID=624315 RepID=A0A6F8YG68_9ACTN|nr:hypothetical protein [Phytohabitans suffuscus]BCB85092.1 hypothetical protein Psuf_024050 [Phytohabitans suffuscus]